MLLTTVYLSIFIKNNKPWHWRSLSETPVVGFGSFVDGFQEQV